MTVEDKDTTAKEEKPPFCRSCARLVCPRARVVNLALGNDDELFCLNCIGRESKQSGQAVRNSVLPYILSRECFRKQWDRHRDLPDCPCCGTAADAHFELNLLGVKCPTNFVKTKLFMDKMQAGQVLTVFLDAGEPAESVSQSMSEEGHEIVRSVQDPGGHFLVSIRKV